MISVHHAPPRTMVSGNRAFSNLIYPDQHITISPTPAGKILNCTMGIDAKSTRRISLSDADFADQDLRSESRHSNSGLTGFLARIPNAVVSAIRRRPGPAGPVRQSPGVWAQ